MIKGLDQGCWTRPSDKQAIYTEIAPGQAWGIRVTLFSDFAKVEAVKGAQGIWYKGPVRYSVSVYPPTFFEKWRGITFEQKIMWEVEKKRAVVLEESSSH